MKKKEKVGIGFALLMGIVLLLPQLVIKGGLSKPEKPKGEPMNPGWLSQWREMRGLTGGFDDVACASFVVICSRCRGRIVAQNTFT